MPVVLKFGKDWMNITLILFVYVIFSSKWYLKKPIHVVSKFEVG